MYTRKNLCVIMFVAIISLCLVIFSQVETLYAGTVPVPPYKDFWQPHYTNWFYSGATITYWWTDHLGDSFEVDQNGKTIKHQRYLPYCIAQNIPIPVNGNNETPGDVKWTGTDWLKNDGKTFCNVDGKSTALTQVNGLWQTDLPAFANSVDAPEINWPSGFVGDLDNVCWGVDVAAYYGSGPAAYEAGKEYHVVNGTCADLPGYVFGTSPIYLDPALGLVTDNPIANATVCTYMEEGMCPEPATTYLLFSGMATVLVLLRRRRRMFIK